MSAVAGRMSNSEIVAARSIVNLFFMVVSISKSFSLLKLIWHLGFRVRDFDKLVPLDVGTTRRTVDERIE